MAVEEVEVFEYEAGSIVDPKSDTKEVFIPSPPTKIEQKINPRPAIILFGGIAEDLKTYADENKIMIVIPNDDSEDTVETTYKYLIGSAKKLNIKADEISVKTTGDVEAAQKAVDYIIDELDGDLDDAEAF